MLLTIQSVYSTDIDIGIEALLESEHMEQLKHIMVKTARD